MVETPSAVKTISDYSTVILCFITIVLAVITFFYLLETKKMRKLAYKTFRVDLSPMVFVDDIKTMAKSNVEKKTLDLETRFYIKNYGKTAAENVRISIEFTSGDSKIVKELESTPYIFPTKTVSFWSNVSLNLTAEGISKIEAAIAAKKIIKMSPDSIPLTHMKIDIKYLDHEKNEKSVQGLFRYNGDKDTWDYMTIEKEQ